MPDVWQVADVASQRDVELILNRSSVRAVADSQVALARVGAERHEQNLGAQIGQVTGRLRKLHVIANQYPNPGFGRVDRPQRIAAGNAVEFERRLEPLAREKLPAAWQRAGERRTDRIEIGHRIKSRSVDCLKDRRIGKTRHPYLFVELLFKRAAIALRLHKPGSCQALGGGRRPSRSSSA